MTSIKYLSKENRNKLAGLQIREYPLPYNPEIKVRVKQQTIARMSRYEEATKQGGGRHKKETYALIADSIVDETGDPVWSKDEVADLQESNCELVTALIRMIALCNGGSNQDIEEMVGNFDETK